MSVSTIEGIVENGQIRIAPGVKLPEHARVYIVIPDESEPTRRAPTPRLANKADAAHFHMELVEEKS